MIEYEQFYLMTEGNELSRYFWAEKNLMRNFINERSSRRKNKMGICLPKPQMEGCQRNFRRIAHSF